MKTFLLMGCALLTGTVLKSNTASLSFDTGDVSVKNTNNLTLLSGGSSAAGDGFVVEIGYYSSSSSADNFLGNWVSITGESSANTAFSSSSIGDISENGANDGTFANSFFFDTTIAATSTTLPSSGRVMTVRFYNATDLAAATHYAAASSDLWVWISPADPQSNMAWSLSDSGVIWEGGFTAFTGNVISPVPEPSSSAALFGAAAFGFCFLRRRRT